MRREQRALQVNKSLMELNLSIKLERGKMTNTYLSKKTKMKRGKYGGIGHCRCSYCNSPRYGRNYKRGNRLRWIIKFDVIPNRLTIKSKY